MTRTQAATTARASSAPVASPQPPVPHPDPAVPLAQQARVALAGLVRRTRPPAYLLLGQARAGSALLGSLLGSVEGVAFAGEQLRGPVRAPLAHLEGLRARSAPLAFGCHAQLRHLSATQGVDDPTRFLSALVARGWVVVHVRRRNLLRQVLADRDGLRVVDPATLLAQLEGAELLLQWERHALALVPHVRVGFETDLAGPASWHGTAARVLAALDRDPAPVATRLPTTCERPLRELLVNYDEVAAALDPTRFAHLLD